MSRERLISQDIPALNQEQLLLFTPEALRVRQALIFNSQVALETVNGTIGRQVMAVDIGGDKITRAIYHVGSNGKLNTIDEKTSNSQNGTGYLEILEGIALEAACKRMPVGISVAGVVEGNCLRENRNIPVFVASLQNKYGSDLEEIFRQRNASLHTVLNDAVAGSVCASLEIARTSFKQKEMIFLINGGGIGGNILAENNIWACEPGHIPVVKALNPHNQTTPCGMSGAEFVCIERVGASGAGIESIYQQQRSQRLSGRDISRQYQEGDELALALYKNSAFIVAHAIMGIARVGRLLQERGDTAIALHGGCFHVPNYPERVIQILKEHLGYAPDVYCTKDFSSNACLEGAAYHVLTKLD